MSFISYDSDQLNYVTSSLRRLRMIITKQIAIIHISNLEKDVNNILIGLVMNCDKVDSLKWPDYKSRNVIMPYRDTFDMFDFPVPRWQKCIGYLVAIWMAGNLMMILLVIDRGSIDVVIWGKWWDDGYGFSFRSNDMPSVTRKIFKEHIIGIFATNIYCISMMKLKGSSYLTKLNRSDSRRTLWISSRMPPLLEYAIKN
jgi:hypothetical protein